MNICPQCAGPIPKAIDESPAPVEYCPHCDVELYLDVRAGAASQWLPDSQ